MSEIHVFLGEISDETPRFSNYDNDPAWSVVGLSVAMQRDLIRLGAKKVKSATGDYLRMDKSVLVRFAKNLTGTITIDSYDEKWSTRIAGKPHDASRLTKVLPARVFFELLSA